MTQSQHAYAVLRLKLYANHSFRSTIPFCRAFRMRLVAWLVLSWLSQSEGAGFIANNENASKSDAEQHYSYLQRDFDVNAELVLTKQRLFMLDPATPDVLIFNRRTDGTQRATVLELDSSFSQHVSQAKPLAYNVMAASPSGDVVLAANSNLNELHILEWFKEKWHLSTWSWYLDINTSGITHLRARDDYIALGRLGEAVGDGIQGQVELHKRIKNGRFNLQKLANFTEDFNGPIVIGYQMALCSQGLLLSIHRPGWTDMEGVLYYAYNDTASSLQPSFIPLFATPIDTHISTLMPNYGSLVVHTTTAPLKIISLASRNLEAWMVSNGPSASNQIDLIAILRADTVVTYLFNPLNGKYDLARQVHLSLEVDGSMASQVQKVLFLQQLPRAHLSMSLSVLTLGIPSFGLLSIDLAALPRNKSYINVSGASYQPPASIGPPAPSANPSPDGSIAPTSASSTNAPATLSSTAQPSPSIPSLPSSAFPSPSDVSRQSSAPPSFPTLPLTEGSPLSTSSSQLSSTKVVDTMPSSSSDGSSGHITPSIAQTTPAAQPQASSSVFHSKTTVSTLVSPVIPISPHQASKQSFVHNQQLLLVLVFLCASIFAMLALLLWRRRQKRAASLQLLSTSMEELSLVLPKEVSLSLSLDD